MKKFIFVACLSALMAAQAFCQSAPGTPFRPVPPQSVPSASPPSPPFANRLQDILNRVGPKPAPPLAKFNLDFPGGTPADLIDAIKTASGKPLNAIIPTDDADVQLPPLRMNDVDVSQLFNALASATRKTIMLQSGPYNNSYSQFIEEYLFSTADNPPSDTSIWFFHTDKPALPPYNFKTCRFFQLTPYLDRGLTVDDITTAIQTGWKMAGIASPPELNYHKETRLLIAFGEPNDLDTIQNVLYALPASSMSSADFNQKISNLQGEVQNLRTQVQVLNQKVSAGK